MSPTETLADQHVLFLSWRDTRNPEGGGAERYLEEVAAGLVARGCRVTIFCAAHPAAPRDEIRKGIRFVRQGSKLSVYARGMLGLLLRRFGRVDVVVDVQNGMPFLSRLVTRKPVIVLVHHVHREQWPVVYPGLMGRIGWAIESRVAPRLYRGSQYVAVSAATRDELRGLGVRSAIAIVHNGTALLGDGPAAKADFPTVCAVGRLVPHKRIEQAIDAVLALRPELSGLRLFVLGDGWWAAHLHDYAEAHGAHGAVFFEGHVSEERKLEVYDRSWVLALPSLKEGWGLVIAEAGLRGTPAVAYRNAGGTRESIEDGRSGLLVDDEDGFREALRAVLTDAELRERLAWGALESARTFSWNKTQESFGAVVAAVLRGERVNAVDPAPEP